MPTPDERAAQTDLAISQASSFAGAMDDLESALAAGVPIADLLAAQDARHGDMSNLSRAHGLQLLARAR